MDFDILFEKFSQLVLESQSFAELQNVKAQILGKNGEITDLLKSISSLSIEEKKTFGASVNILKNKVEDIVQKRAEHFKDEETRLKLETERLDISLPLTPLSIGKIHPITRLMMEIENFFKPQGFTFVDGQELEDEWHNFDALNIPHHHPARQDHDTFYVKGSLKSESNQRHVLRTHTSNTQIRYLKDHKPPLRMISHGKVYRSDAIDATHTPMFHQMECLVIEPKISFAHLKHTIQTFLEYIFGSTNIPIRFRPSYFPFTEPSAEVDVRCISKNNQLIFSNEGNWMEILGCGMVHPNVIKNCNLDPNQYQGFAFGVGLERLAMLKYGITDIRQFYNNHPDWINHFGSNPLCI
ncbi:MAG: phenylalanine--tRNA ligase subunit alpha [Candidatus Puniceispirillum sp.]|nr:phenylalanine--tRNA ligase subunit alpha [Candidatus Pelagibacter sp.]MBA4282787.1 phenylalanine--tRNA ligase subunit alpha [Candidatus Puniceispirillum sp.]